MMSDEDLAEYRRSGGCICPIPRQKADGSFDWKIRDDCRYHVFALKFAGDHRIPWNCPTYWDGCNCASPTGVLTQMREGQR